MNPRFRSRVESLIKDAMQTFIDTSAEEHPGIKGLAREIAIEMLFRPLLPQGVGVGTGKIIDSAGNESRQIDLILHHTNILPAVMFGDNFGLFPVESCLYAIEVKSMATAQNASASCEVARSIAALQPVAGYYPFPSEDQGGGKQLVPLREAAGRFPNFGYFAFSTDLVPDGPQSREIDRFITALEGDSHHSIHLVVACIAGSVTTSRSRQQEQWRHVSHTDQFNEIVYFLSSILNTVSKMLFTRASPNIGRYLWDNTD